jgi:hypothetical protein
MDRRSFLAGIIPAIAAPAVILRPGILMPLRGILMAPSEPCILLLDESQWADTSYRVGE